MEEFVCVEKTGKNFNDACVSVLNAAEKQGWAIFGVIDISERLAAKGFAHPPLKIIEICSAKHADRILKMERMVSLCMPCRICVMQEENGVAIAGMMPGVASKFFEKIKPEEVAPVEEEIRQIIRDSK